MVWRESEVLSSQCSVPAPLVLAPPCVYVFIQAALNAFLSEVV